MTKLEFFRKWILLHFGKPERLGIEADLDSVIEEGDTTQVLDGRGNLYRPEREVKSEPAPKMQRSKPSYEEESGGEEDESESSEGEEDS